MPSGFAGRELTIQSPDAAELLTVPVYAVACVFVVITSIMADRQKTRFRYMMLDLILCFFGLIINCACIFLRPFSSSLTWSLECYVYNVQS